jgi:hypothetical protein
VLVSLYTNSLRTIYYLVPSVLWLCCHLESFHM